MGWEKEEEKKSKAMIARIDAKAETSEEEVKLASFGRNSTPILIDQFILYPVQELIITDGDDKNRLWKMNKIDA